MKEYHEASYGKNSLLTVAIVLTLVSLIALGGGIALLVLGCMSTVVGQIVWMVIVGSLLILASLGGCIFGFKILFVSLAMLNNKEGNVKDGNRAIGTINRRLCPKCGREVDENSVFCSHCGEKLEGTKQCECGENNPKNAQFCAKCGKKL